jgi:hypothetical protein
MRGSVTALTFLALMAAAGGCSVLVSTTGLSSGSDADGGGAPENPPPEGASSSGVSLGDASAAPGPSVGSDGAAPGAILGDSSSPSPSPTASQPDAGKDAAGSVDAAGSADSGAKVDATPPPPPSACSLGHARVFVTSTMYDGTLGGVSGADSACLTRATAGGLGGQWRAWLSDTSMPAVGHIDPSKGSYELVDGTTVATSFNALTSGSLSHAIDLSETGALVTDGNTEVWTGMDVTNGLGNGGFCTDPGGHDWSSNTTSAPTPLVGHLDATDSTWSAAYLQVCNRTNVRLYCFETCP